MTQSETKNLLSRTIKKMSEKEAAVLLEIFEEYRKPSVNCNNAHKPIEAYGQVLGELVEAWHSVRTSEDQHTTEQFLIVGGLVFKFMVELL